MPSHIKNKTTEMHMHEIIYNLKKQDGFLKGDIAEIIGRHKIRYCHRTREMPRDFLKKEFPFKISRKIMEYLYHNWYTIDLFKFVVKNNKVENIEVYEVKARNWYSNPEKVKFPIPNITSRALKAYKEAISRGFIVKYIEIHFLDDWQYTINFRDFSKQEFIVHDKPGSCFNKVKKAKPFNPLEFKSIM
jgi:hypothetical protein